MPLLDLFESLEGGTQNYVVYIIYSKCWNSTLTLRFDVQNWERPMAVSSEEICLLQQKYLAVLMAVSENSKSLAFNYLTDFCRGKNKHLKSRFLFFKLMLHVLFIYISTLCKLKGFLNSHRHQHTARHFCYKRHISIFTIFSLQFCSWITTLLLCLHLQNTTY